MVTNKEEEMEKLMETTGEFMNVSEMKKNIHEAGIFDYSERAIKLYLDSLVNADFLIAQKVKIGKNKTPSIYTKNTDKEKFKVTRTCKARNDFIYKEICNEFCEEINCNAYYSLFKNSNLKHKK